MDDMSIEILKKLDENNNLLKVQNTKINAMIRLLEGIEYNTLYV